MQDLRVAFRVLGRERAFAATVVLVLALGIGANVAVFSVVHTILMRPLPFHDPARLVWLATNGGRGGLSEQTYTVSAFEEFRRNNRSFQDVASYQTFFNSIQYKLTGRGAPLPLTGVQVSENFFPMLGVEPAAGRLFTPEECRKGARAAVLLSHAFWERQFAGDPRIVGKSLEISASPADLAGPATVVGVLPASFDFGAIFSPGMRVDIFVPAYMDFWRGWGNTLAVVGRLKPGVSLGQAQAESDVLFPRLRAAHRDWWEDYRSTLTILQEHVSGKLRRSLGALWGAVAVMLLIVCANVSNLMLARSISRSREYAVRAALGAGRWRLVRQLAVEDLVLAGAGATLGLAIAWGVTFLLARQNQMALPLLATVRVDGAALAWAALLTVCAAVVFAIAPAWRVAAANLQDMLRSRTSRERLRSVLVVSEVALACVLLVGAGLLLRSFLRLLDVDLGFAPTNVAAVKVELADGGSRARRGPLLREILRRVRAIPGIEAAGMTDMLPLDRNRSWGLTAKENAHDRKPHPAFVYVVTPGYLEAMGMRLLRGRDVSWQDGPGGSAAIVINEAAARREWPGQDPVGRPAADPGDGGGRVVGVVADVRESSLEERASVQMYLPMTQYNPEGAELVVRTRLPIASVAPVVMATLRSLNPGQPRADFRPIQQIVDHAVSPRRFLAMLVAAFAAVGLLLACLGIYGVISYSVTRRAQEIGIRMALGATAGRVQASVLGQTARLALAGIAIGGAGGFIAARGMRSLLFGTGPADPLVFAATAGMLAGIALLAALLPARRAARIDPMAVLRSE